MSLSDLAAIGSLVSGVAVAGSLVYLGLQTHQAAKHTRALIAQGRATRTLDWCLAAADADLAAAVIVANGGVPTPEAVKRGQFYLLGIAMFASADETFNHHQIGLLDEHHFGSFRGSMESILGQPGFRQAWEDWKTVRPGANPKFIQFMDGIVASSRVGPTAALMG